MTPRAPAFALVLLAAACGGGDAVPDDVIDRETFIATYVDLRWAAVETPDFRIPADQRDRILASHGVDAEGLMRFADAHGRDLDFMNVVWTEVDTRIAARQSDGETDGETDGEAARPPATPPAPMR